MNARTSPPPLPSLQTLLRRAYELADCARSKFDSAPVPKYLICRPGHVDEDKQFCGWRNQLRSDLKSLLEDSDPLEYQRFLARLERYSPPIQQAGYFLWNGTQRCGCWWNAKDHLQEIAAYLEELISNADSKTETGIMQKEVHLRLLGKKRMDYQDDVFKCSFEVSIVDSSLVGQPRERSETRPYWVEVGMTWELRVNWGLDKLRVNWGLDNGSADIGTAKVLFEHCREHVVKRTQQGLSPEPELLLTTENSPDHCPYDISLIADPTTPTSFEVSVDSPSLPQQDRKIELFVDDIDSFSKAQNVRPQEVKALLPLNLPEDEIQTFFEDIIGENFHQPDWGGEMNDLVTSHIRVGGKRLRAVFILKGRGTSGKLTIAKCGKNGDQIVRLVEGYADLYIIQHVDEIDQRVVSDLQSKVESKASKGEKCQMCILDGTDTARILKAYGKI